MVTRDDETSPGLARALILPSLRRVAGLRGPESKQIVRVEQTFVFGLVRVQVKAGWKMVARKACERLPDKDD